MLTLPRDLIRYLASFLLHSDILKFWQTCTYVKESINANFWLNKSLTDYPLKLKYLSEVCRDGMSNKNLYVYLNERSQIFNIYHIKLKQFDENEFQLPLNLRRGDVIQFGSRPIFRNENKLIWIGEKLIDLDYSKDDYGSVPSEFCFPEFSPNYFIDSIVHNTYINFSEEKLKQLQNNFNVETQTSYVTDKYSRYECSIASIHQSVFFRFSKICTKLLLEYNDGKINIIVPTWINKDVSRILITFNDEWKDAVTEIKFAGLYEWKLNKLVLEKYMLGGNVLND